MLLRIKRLKYISYVFFIFFHILPSLSPTAYKLNPILSLLTALPLRYLYCCKDFISQSLSPSFFLSCVVLCCVVLCYGSALSAHFLTLDPRNGAAFSKFIFKTYRIALWNTIHDFSHPHVF